MKVVLVTGANSGIGLEASRQLASAGCTVLVAARTVDKAARATAEVQAVAMDGGSAEPMVLDLADLASIKAWASAYLASGRTLDAIVCNAGVAPDREGSGAGGATRDEGLAVQRTADGFEQTIGVNHLSHFALVLELMPALLSTPHSRVVITSGEIHNPESPDGKNGSPPTLGALAGLASGAAFNMCDGGTFDGNKSYKDSKLCGILFMRELARRLGEVEGGVVANAFSPGFVPSSALFRNQVTTLNTQIPYPGPYTVNR